MSGAPTALVDEDETFNEWSKQERAGRKWRRRRGKEKSREAGQVEEEN